MQDVYIVSAARTAIGSFGGTLSKMRANELGTISAKAAIERAGVDPEKIDGAVYGNVIPSEPREAYISRIISVNAGLPTSTHAFGVNRLCGSGAQAIVSAAQMIKLDDADIMLAGGAESMSLAPYSVKGARSGLRMGEGVLEDWLTGALTDPFGNGGMGITAENVAAKYGISRERQDEFALESQRRCAEAIKNGYFTEQIVPVEVKSKRGSVSFEVDEHPRETSLEKLASLRPVFKKDGTVTAGNASGMNDAAASVILAGQGAVDSNNLTPQARIVSWGFGGVPPEVMGLGPNIAVPKALKKAGLSIDDMDVIESNEAFAAQAIAVADELHFDPAKVNPNGGAISHGHPISATGAILTTKALYELKRINGRYGLITMCIGGGQGIALIIERV